MAGDGVSFPHVTEPVQPSGPSGRMLTSTTARRIGLFGSIVMVLFGILVVRLWFLQVVGAAGFEQRAEGNSVRTINIPAPRGDILDRNGKVIATSREAWDVVALPQDLGEGNETDYQLTPEGDATLKRVAAVIGVKPAVLRNRMKRGNKSAAFKSVVLQPDLAEDDPLFLALNERIREFPGIRLERTFRRRYEQGAYLSHVLGYVGQIPVEDADAYRKRGYRNDAIVGRAGLESEYERFLRGEDGERRIEVDGSGQPTGRNVLSERPAKPGATLTTSIDIDVQTALDDAVAEAVLTKSEFDGGGGGVVLDAQTGQVVAMSSFPQVDPVLYSRGKPGAIKAYEKKWKSRSFGINRAVWAYPPASTFKPVTAIAALNSGALQPDEPLTSPKQLIYGGTVFRNFRGLELPDMSVRGALMMSSDTFFYQVGNRIHLRTREPGRREGNNKLRYWSQALGLGATTQVDLPEGAEASGVLPDRDWKRSRTFAIEAPNTWRPGDTINMSVGQGFLTATPLQMARAYAAIIDDEHRLRTPTIGDKIRSADDPNNILLDITKGLPESTLPTINPGVLEAVTGGLYDVVNNSQGTAQSVFSKLPNLVAGKTGTAENSRNGKARKDHSWFVGYGPVGGDEPPKYIVAVVIQNGGLGTVAATPAACKALVTALDRDPSDCNAGRNPSATAVAD